MDSNKLQKMLLWVLIGLILFVGLPLHYLGPKKSTSSQDDPSTTLDFNDLDGEAVEKLFLNFTKVYKKAYDPHTDEGKNRLKHFKHSLSQISTLNLEAKHQAGLLSSGDPGHKGSHSHSKTVWHPGMPKNQGAAYWGLTSLADLSPEEFKKSYLDPSMETRVSSRNRSHFHGHRRRGHSQHHEEEGLKYEWVSSTDPDQEGNDNLITRRRRSLGDSPALPLKVDWRTKNIVTPVKHQKACGACWAFSTVQTVESMHALQNGELKTLSVQQVIDCSNNGNMGCNGGDTCTAVRWMSGRKLAEEKDYPLTLKDGQCMYQSAKEGVEVNSNYTCENFEGRENGMLEILAKHGPVAVAVDATTWQFYIGGVIQGNCDTRVNHAVQIVGYDKTVNPPHYIIRNSWGKDFGDQGYLYVAIGSNLCGIAREVTWLSVK